ncbi:MAG: nickel-dependent hydrogenase large subunit [Betaproteobacteria bacterium]|nr:nickel-dependent hydrogenase large subunit [Betaproteobacteria bacterium]
MSASLEGRIDIRHAGGQWEIRSTRPQLAQRLLAGRSPAEAAELAGTLFSLCGQAQRAAARAACAAALGQPLPDLNREVLAELAREHAWRLVLDWPRELGKNVGQNPNPAALPRLMQIGPQPDALGSWLEEHLLGEPPETWLARDWAGLQAWISAGSPPIATLFQGLAEDQGEGSPFLPPLSALTAPQAAALAQHALDTPEFCARPEWQGVPAETGAVARQAGHPLVRAWIEQRGRGIGARQLARLVELAQLPQRLRPSNPAADLIRAWTLEDNTGLAGVETSRGLLLHGVRIETGRISQYRIIAPTEWNFHPAGPLARALQALPPGPDLELRARLAAQALDPCVAYGIEIDDA